MCFEKKDFFVLLLWLPNLTKVDLSNSRKEYAYLEYLGEINNNRNRRHQNKSNNIDYGIGCLNHLKEISVRARN
jgi:hypothetical protein